MLLSLSPEKARGQQKIMMDMRTTITGKCRPPEDEQPSGDLWLNKMCAKSAGMLKRQR
jgi:hypothetical protein